MDEAALLAFLFEASRRGYAAGRDAAKAREVDGSTTIVYAHGDWTFHDNYFGGEPYGGREVVFLNRQPVWMALYYGWVEGVSIDVERVYSFLQRALREAPATFPVRRPDHFSEGLSTYRNVHRGSVANFLGEETIHEDRQELQAKIARRRPGSHLRCYPSPCAVSGSCSSFGADLCRTARGIGSPRCGP